MLAYACVMPRWRARIHHDEAIQSAPLVTSMTLHRYCIYLDPIALTYINRLNSPIGEEKRPF